MRTRNAVLPNKTQMKYDKPYPLNRVGGMRLTQDQVFEKTRYYFSVVLGGNGLN
jgi:hypothetical protein